MSNNYRELKQVNPTDLTTILAETSTQASWAESVLFWVLAGACLLATIGVVISKEIVRTAMCLLGTLVATAGLYLLLGGYFLAAVQLIVYAGGTLVLIVFGVMLTGRSSWANFQARRGELLAGTVVCAVLLVALLKILLSTPWPAASGQFPEAPVARIGQELLGGYLVPFEVASILLLVVMIGAAFLARPIRRSRRGERPKT